MSKHCHLEELCYFYSYSKALSFNCVPVITLAKQANKVSSRCSLPVSGE